MASSVDSSVARIRDSLTIVCSPKKESSLHNTENWSDSWNTLETCVPVIKVLGQ